MILGQFISSNDSSVRMLHNLCLYTPCMILVALERKSRKYPNLYIGRGSGLGLGDGIGVRVLRKGGGSAPTLAPAPVSFS